MGPAELQLPVPVYVALCASTLLYTLVWWRIFNKAHRSGILLTWGLVQAAGWPWLVDPDPWLVLAVFAISFLVSVAVVSTMVSIIGRPWWWVVPVALSMLPQLAIMIWAVQASAFEDLPDSLGIMALVCWTVAVLMGIPLYVIGMSDLGDAFGYGIGFRLGLVFLPIVFLPVLAFSSNRYGDWGRVARERSDARRRSVISASLAGTGAPAHPSPSSGMSLPPLHDAPDPADTGYRAGT